MDADSLIERIEADGELLVVIIRAEYEPASTTFLTPPEFKQQVGFIVYPGGTEIARHLHHPIERRIVGTSEVLVIKRGRCAIDVYTDDEVLVTSRELTPGDVVLMVNGGHGFRVHEDTVILEMKQGPYTGLDEKRRF